jgi:hypothetical protein
MNVRSAYIPTFEHFPEDETELRIKLSSIYTAIAIAINVREIGLYQNTLQTATGQLFSGTSGTPQKDAFRKVFYFGPSLAGATTTIAHDISSITSFTKISGTVCTASDFRPIPNASVTAASAGIEIKADATNIYVINGSTAPAIVSGIVVVEYLCS